LLREITKALPVKTKRFCLLPIPDSQRTKALFNLGLIYAHFGNPQQDLEKSIEFFKTLIKNSPEKPSGRTSQSLVEILQENEELNHLLRKLKQVDIEIEEMKRKKTQ